jgi:uncharacterized phage protein (TIGR01671 family)
MMYRTFKFRAWDMDRGVMVIPDWISYDGDVYDDVSDLGPCHSESYVLMQFTGFIDINGEEIYEGDILKYGYIVTFIDGSDLRQLGMDSGFYAQRDGYESWSMLEVGAEYEVIGNIYEDSKLLGGVLDENGKNNL